MDFCIDGPSQEDFLKHFHCLAPELEEIQQEIRGIIYESKREVFQYQAAFLYLIARQFRTMGRYANFLEIGSAYGYSAAHLSYGAPQATVVGLNPKESEITIAAASLRDRSQVRFVKHTSEWLWAMNQIIPTQWDLIFVDGDHRLALFDFNFYYHLRPGGIILFHDYSPENSSRPTAEVFKDVNRIRDDIIKRPFDISIVDDGLNGLVGWIKAE